MRRLAPVLAVLFILACVATANAQATTAPVIPVAPVPGTLAQRTQSFFGLMAFTFLAFLIGKARGAKRFPWRVVLWGSVLDFAFGAIVIFSPRLLELIQDAIQKLLDFTLVGERVIFGSGLVDGVLPVVSSTGAPLGVTHVGFIFGVVVLPTIIFIAMLTAMLYHTGIMTVVVHGLAWVMQKTMGTSGAETLSTAANIFVGQTEAPLLVKPFLEAATSSELMAIMVGGFANIASGVLVVYTDFLKTYVLDVGGHLAAACFISAPATLVVAKLMMPETDKASYRGGRGVQGRAGRCEPDRRRHARHHRGPGLGHQRRRHADHVHRARRDARCRLRMGWRTIRSSRRDAGTHARVRHGAARLAERSVRGTMHDMPVRCSGSKLC